MPRILASGARRRSVAVLIAVGTLAGCSAAGSAGSPPPRVSDGAASSAASGPNRSGPTTVAGFRHQRLNWHSCHDGMQCTTLLVPLDYDKPAGRLLHVAVIRKPASGQSQGSLIVNPGGPGASGVDFVLQASSVFSQLTTRFDLVSFDPRGVGGSDPIRCLTPSQLDAYVNINPDPKTAAQRAALVAASRHFANACWQRNGSYLAHVSTLDEARDMDVLRAALGDRKLTYYGASYGTYLGAKYAQLFPHRIRAMVLDGALDPASPATVTSKVQALGFETDLHDFLGFCVNSGNCPLGTTVSGANAGLSSLTDRITSHPLSVGNRMLGAGEFFEGLAAALYSPSTWSELQTFLGAAKGGNGAGMLLFADSLTERHNDGTYSNLIEANMAINCVDRPSPKSVSAYVAAARRFAKIAPHFGAPIEYGSMPCAFWHVPAVESPHPVTAPGAPPILVIGTTRDPATPYVWAKALARQLSSGVLLTYDGDGHTAYIRRDACVDAAVANYVLRLAPPAAGTVCH